MYLYERGDWGLAENSIERSVGVEQRHNFSLLPVRLRSVYLCPNFIKIRATKPTKRGAAINTMISKSNDENKPTSFIVDNLLPKITRSDYPNLFSICGLVG